MNETLISNENYRSYIRSVLRMYAYLDANLFDSDEADVLREQMIKPWYALSQEERKRMDGLVMDLNVLRESRERTGPIVLSEKQHQEGLARIREVFDLKSAGRYDEALTHLRKWQNVIAPQFVWHFRGSCWNFMEVPEVAVEFFREAVRIDPSNEKFAGVYLATLKKTNFEEAKKIAGVVMKEPKKHDLTLVVYAADVEANFINFGDEAKLIDRTRRLANVLENVMQRLIAGEIKEQGPAVVGMAGMLLSSCYVTLGDTEQAHGLLTFLINAIEPNDPLLYAARGKLNYPTKDDSVKDLITSINLGLAMSWPFVWIATYYLEKGEYSACKKTCLDAFKRPLVPKIRSELLELLAIAEASSGAGANDVRKLFEEAIQTDIKNTRAIYNLTKFEELVHDPTKLVGWRRDSLLLDKNPERIEEKNFTESLQKDLAIAA
jgi:tetratricopeptide (TPR) repeat protein